MAAYITLADVRAAGVTVGTASDAAVNAAIALWQQVIERYCRQWFDERPADFRVDGTDSDTIHLGIPIITLSALYINDDTSPLDPTLYRIYTRREMPDDDRWNPRIKIRSLNDFADIYTAPIGNVQKFRKGRQNQRLVGTFGFTEADGSTPAAIKRALLKLVIQKVTTPLYVDPAGPPPPAPPPPIMSGIVAEEQTDGHMIRYANVFDVAPRRADNMMDVIQDPEIRGLLKLYRAPIAMAAPANPSFSE